MLINDTTPQATNSLANLFDAIDRKFAGRLVAIGRPEPAVDNIQRAHVRIAYTGPTGANPSGFFDNGTRVCIVHTVNLHEDGRTISLHGGTYDLTPVQAWGMVR